MIDDKRADDPAFTLTRGGHVATRLSVIEFVSQHVLLVRHESYDPARAG